VQRTRKDRVTGSRSWTSLTTTARTLSWSFMRLALTLVLAALADLQCKFLSWRCVRCQVNRQISEPWMFCSSSI